MSREFSVIIERDAEGYSVGSVSALKLIFFAIATVA